MYIYIYIYIERERERERESENPCNEQTRKLASLAIIVHAKWHGTCRRRHGRNACMRFIARSERGPGLARVDLKFKASATL